MKKEINETGKMTDARLLRAIAAAETECKESSIGRLGEKMLHRTLKYYLEPDRSYHEVDLLGSVADIKRGDRIIEIQTRSFSRLGPKLEKFLQSHSVTVVYPVVTERTVCWCDPESGELISERTSSKKCRPCDLFSELTSIPDRIGKDGLSFMLIPVKAREYRLLDGRGKDKKLHATRLNTHLCGVGEALTVRTAKDLAALIPDNLGEKFTARDFSRVMRLRGIKASLTLRLVCLLGIAEKIGKEGNAFVYERKYFS